MSTYDTDIKTLRTNVEELNYKKMPFVTDIDNEDFSTAFQHKGYTLIPTSIDDETISNNHVVGDRSYTLQVTYLAKTAEEYDKIWNEFESLYRKIHGIVRSINFNELTPIADKEFLYKGQMEFYYGQRSCS